MSKKMNKISAVISLFFFVASIGSAYCEEQPEEKLVTSLKKGDKAPYNGVLLSNSLAAEIKNNCDPEVIQKRCDIRISEAVDLSKSSCKKETDILTAKLSAQEEKYQKIIFAKDEEIKTLNDLLRSPAWYKNPKTWFFTGIVLGAGTTIYLVKKF